MPPAGLRLAGHWQKGDPAARKVGVELRPCTGQVSSQKQLLGNHPKSKLTLVCAASHSRRTASTLARPAAMCSATAPSVPIVAHGSAPACKRAATHSVWPSESPTVARWRGSRSAGTWGTAALSVRSAPATRSRFTHSAWPMRQALHRAVAPPRSWFTFTPAVIAASSSVTLPLAAASCNSSCRESNIQKLRSRAKHREDVCLF